MFESRRRTGFAPGLIAAFALTMSVALGGCAAQQQLADSAAPMPLGDWWPASADAGSHAAQAQAAPASEALGDWWPSLTELHPSATLTATAQGERAEQ